MWRSAKLRRQLLGSSLLQRCAWHPPTATTAPQFMTAGGPRSSTTCLPHAMQPLPSFKWLADHQLVITREMRSMRVFPHTSQPPSASSSSSSSPFRLPLATLPPVQTLTLPTAHHLHPPLAFRPFDKRTTSSRPFSTNPGPHPPPHHRQALADRSRRAAAAQSLPMVLYLFALVVAMVGATYASVPLYRMFCAATGFGGTVQRRESVEEKIVRHGEGGQDDSASQRELTIQFNADVADGMPWRFLPSQREVKVRPGQSTLAFYTAHNLSDDSITGVSTYNVSPMKAGAYFNKIQCFCFEEQRLRPHEKIDMPVFFYIDPEFATDPKMAGVNLLTLSYTFFKVEDDGEEK